jgi:hypothetical protein
MKTLVHTVFTWTVAHICLPFAFMIYVGISNGEGLRFQELSSMAEVSFYIFLCSLPSLFISWPFLSTILKMEDGVFIKAIWWLIVVGMVVFINHTIVMMILSGGHLEGGTLKILVPVLLSIAIAMIMRMPAFVNLNESQTKTA